jgi:hypothetical protein
MVIGPLHPSLLHYLSTVQRSTKIGFREVVHAQTGRSERTVYRWRRVLGEQLHVIPSVITESLGLLHAHVLFDEELPPEDLPYIVEAAQVSPDLVRRRAYAHLLVPVTHQRFVEQRVRGKGTLVWSGTGWQQFAAPGEALITPAITALDANSEVMRQYPFVIPALIEGFEAPNSMRHIWLRAHARLGRSARAWVRCRPRVTNGKYHVHRAYDLLERFFVVRQHIIRYHPLLAASVELMFLWNGSKDDLTHLLTSLRHVVHASELYPTTNGFFLRVLGPYSLIDALLAASSDERSRLQLWGINTKRRLTGNVTFDYVQHFDPLKGTWRDPPEDAA